MTTIPVPMFTLALRWDWPTRAPEKAVRALAMHSPTVMVKFGLMEEALTMSRLSPVARMDRPSRVPRKATSSRAAPTVSTPPSRISLQAPPIPVAWNMRKIVSWRSRLAVEVHPMAIRLMV